MIKPDFSIIGKKFKLFTVAAYKFTKNKITYWECECFCGTIKILQRTQIGRIQSCGCLRKSTMKEFNKTKIKPIQESGANKVYNIYISRSRQVGRLFTILKSEFKNLLAQPCSYCGAPPSNHGVNQATKQVFNYNGIDRVDNNEGYTTKNCVTCCKICNFAKSKLSHTEFIDYLDNLVKYRNSLSEKKI